jgi:hypothetical protein
MLVEYKNKLIGSKFDEQIAVQKKVKVNFKNINNRF